MTATTTPSAYPKSVDELIPHARDLAAQLGEIPSRNLLMKTFKVGGPKAKALLAALTPDLAAPAAPTAVESVPVETAGESTCLACPEGCPECSGDESSCECYEHQNDHPDEAVPPALPRAAVAEPGDDMTAFRNAAGDLMVTYPNAAGDLVTERVSAVPETVRRRAQVSGLLAAVEPKPLDLPLPAAEPVEPPAAESVVEPVPQPKRRRPVVWPVLILCLPAFVAIWGGWVEMGRLTGFGMVTLLPGISDFQINTAITLPIGMETLAAYALYVWLSGMVTGPALRFAKWSALVSLTLGALGQIAYHLMASWGWTSAPWPITAAVACIPVAVLGMGAGLAHLMHRSH